MSGALFSSMRDVVGHDGTAAHHTQLHHNNVRQDILLRAVSSLWVLLDAIPSRLTFATESPDTYFPQPPSSPMDQSREAVVDTINLQALLKYLSSCQGGRAIKAQMEDMGPFVDCQWSLHIWQNCFGCWHPETNSAVSNSACFYKTLSVLIVTIKWWQF